MLEIELDDYSLRTLVAAVLMDAWRNIRKQFVLNSDVETTALRNQILSMQKKIADAEWLMSEDSMMYCDVAGLSHKTVAEMAAKEKRRWMSQMQKAHICLAKRSLNNGAPSS